MKDRLSKLLCGLYFFVAVCGITLSTAGIVLSWDSAEIESEMVLPPIIIPLAAKTPEPATLSAATVSSVMVVLEPVVHGYFIEEEPEPRYGFTEDEIYLLAQTMCGDADIDGDGEYDFEWFPMYGMDIPQEQINLPLCVVMNRVRSDKFPDTVSDVLLQRGQFAVFPRNKYTTPGEFAIEKIREWCEAYDNYEDWVQTIPEEHLYFRSGPRFTNVSR